MLKLIFGRAGSGKSHFIKNKIAEITQNGGRAVLIVPEQSSFDRERELLNGLGEELYGSVDVFSFTRLAQRMPMLYKLSQINSDLPADSGSQGETIDVFGRIMLMSRTLITVRDKLRLYARQINSTDFMLRLLTLFAEFKSSCVFPEDLLRCANRMKSGVLKQKLSELYEIYSIYTTMLKNKYTDAQDMLDRLCEILKNFDFFADKTVFVDSFKDFTYQEKQILRHIMRQSDDAYIALCTDKLSYSSGDEFGLFYPCVKTARELIAAAKADGISCSAPLEMQGSHRFESDALIHLEQNLLSSEAERFEDDTDDIEIYAAQGQTDEVEQAARRIRQLTQNGMRYRDIAVIARDMSSYESAVQTVFDRYDIPVFLDKRSSVECTPLFFLVLSALDIASGGYDSDSIFKYLKSGLTDISDEDISILENYTVMWRISGNRWLHRFAAHPDGLGKKSDEDSESRLAHINELRESIISPLRDFSEKCKNASGRQIAQAIYELLLRLNVPEALQKLTLCYELQGENALSEEQNRLWELLMDILDRAYEISGDEIMEISVFTRIMRTAITFADLGHIPQTLDCVAAGSAERMKPFAPKAVFILGTNDEVFPKKVSSTGLFNENERRSLLDAELRLTFDPKDAVSDENLLLYGAVTCASQKLFVSYQSTNLSGEMLMPSSLIDELFRIFPNIKLTVNSNEPEKLIFNDKTAFDLLAQSSSNPSALFSSLCEYLGGSEQYKAKVNAVINKADNALGSISSENSQLLFSKSKTLSSSKVDSFYKCRYRYFCEYGLKLRRRESGDIDSRMFGTILHYCLEKLMSGHTKQQLINMSRAERNSLVEKIADSYCQQYMGGLEDKPARFVWLFYRWINNCKLIAANIIKELSGSDYSPTDFEMRIGRDIAPYELILADGSRIKIIGSVDRVDTAQAGSRKYLRIIDYKSGKKQFKLSSVMDGLDMQMLIYLFAIIKNGGARYGSIIPAGVLYMHSTAVSNRSDNFDEEKALAAFSDKLRMNGLLLDDADSVLMMEYDGKGSFIPLSIDKNGEIKKTKDCPSFTDDQLQILQKYVDEKIKSMAQQIKSGDMSPDPIETDRGTVCDWCDYKTLCTRRNIRARKANHLKNAECYEEMQKQLNGSKESEV